MPKKSMFGFISISPIHKAGTVFHSGIRFPQFLTFVLLALFVATSQANRRFQTAAAGCRSTGLAPLRGSLRAAPITFRCGWTGVPLIGWQGHRKTACQSCFRLDGAARHFIGPSLYRKSVQVVFAHPPHRFPSSGLPTDVLLDRIFSFQRTTEVNVPLFNPTEIRVLSGHF